MSLNTNIAAARRAKIVPIVIGAAFCLVSMLILWVGFLRPLMEEHELETWDAVSCRIERVNVRQRSIEQFEFTATYSYEVEGRKLRSSTVGRKGRSVCRFESVAHRLPLLSEYACGTEHVCRVKPGSPLEVVLPIAGTQTSAWTSMVPIAFLVVFGLIGVFLVTLGIFGLRRQGPSRLKSVVMLVFGILFGLILMVVGARAFQQTVQRRQEGKSYLPTPARVLYSGVKKTHRSSGRHGSQTTYGTVVGYAYEVDGVAYENDRWGMVDVMTGDHARHRQEADRHRKGDAITVWRSPDNPRQTVVDRTADGAWLLLLLPFIVLLGGTIVVGSIWYFARTCRKRRRVDEVLSFSNRRLERSYAEVWNLGVFACAWNVFGWGMALAFMGSAGTWKSPTVMVCLFPVLGLVFACAFVRRLVGEFAGPDFRLTLTSVDWRPGGSASVGYEQVGEGGVGMFTASLVESPRREAFSTTGTRRARGVPVTRSVQVHSSSMAATVGGFSFEIPNDFSPEVAWRLALVYQVDGRSKPIRRVYSLPD